MTDIQTVTLLLLSISSLAMAYHVKLLSKNVLTLSEIIVLESKVRIEEKKLWELRYANYKHNNLRPS